MSSQKLQSSSGTYALQTGQAASKRLEIQSGYMHKESSAHLKKAGLKKGQVVYDIGCGAGHMTAYIASIVGPEGHVYAVDSSASQLEIAKKRIEGEGLKNITFIQASILDVLDLKAPLADLVYARCLLMHLNNPEKAVKNMMTILKPGGALALQEPITSSCYVAGDKNLLQGFVKVLLALGEHLNVDYDMGLRLMSLVEKQGFKEVSRDEHQYKFDPDFARSMLAMTLKEWGPRAIQEGIISQSEFSILEEEIEKLKTPFFISKSVYVTAWKS